MLHGSFCSAVFILDPWFANPMNVGVNRYRFLLQSLEVCATFLLGWRHPAEVHAKRCRTLTSLCGLWIPVLLLFVGNQLMFFQSSGKLGISLEW